MAESSENSEGDQPETHNPYAAPRKDAAGERTAESDEPTGTSQPSWIDWSIALFLGCLAFAFVFPTTCVGAFLIIPGLFVIHGNQTPMAEMIGWVVCVSSFLLAIFLGYKLAGVYIRLCRKRIR